jgi:hypothetical protein
MRKPVQQAHQIIYHGPYNFFSLSCGLLIAQKKVARSYPSFPQKNKKRQCGTVVCLRERSAKLTVENPVASPYRESFLVCSLK